MSSGYEHSAGGVAAGPMTPIRGVSRRYGVTERTIHRWLAQEALAFPKPIYINHRRYWYVAELAAWEQIARRKIAAPGLEQVA